VTQNEAEIKELRGQQQAASSRMGAMEGNMEEMQAKLLARLNKLELELVCAKATITGELGLPAGTAGQRNTQHCAAGQCSALQCSAVRDGRGGASIKQHAYASA